MSTPAYTPFSGHNKLSALLIGANFSLVDKVSAFVNGMFEFTVPDGYEDESGFHLVSVSTEDHAGTEQQVWLGMDI